MALGYRDPMTYRNLPTIPSLALTNHILNIEKMKEAYDNVSLHQYVHELMRGEDPRKSDWYTRLYG